MKRRIFLFAAALCAVRVFSADFSASELSLFNEMNAAFDTGFYPGAVSRAAALEEHYPESVFIVRTVLTKSGALIELGRYAEASDSLGKIISSVHIGSPEYERLYFLLGKARAACNDPDGALKAFSKCISVPGSAQDELLFMPEAVFLSSGIYFSQGDYASAVPLLEFIVGNGKKYRPEDYYVSLLRLAASYNASGEFRSAAELARLFGRDQLPDDVYFRLVFYGAAADEAAGNFSAAYKAYCSAGKSGIREIASESLKRAYLLSEEYGDDAGTADVLAAASDGFSGFPSLAAELWLRLGIDAYTGGKIPEALAYFDSAEANSPSADVESALFIYRMKVRLDLCGGDDPDSAAGILSALESRSGEFCRKDGTTADSFNALLVDAMFRAGRISGIPEVFARIKNPDPRSEYVYSAALFELGDYRRAAAEAGKNAFSGRKISDPASALVLAASYSKLGEYSKSAEIYGRILEYAENSADKPDSAVGKIDSIRTEYSKALFASGDYRAAAAQSEMAETAGAAAVAALSEFNMKNWRRSLEFFNRYSDLIEKDDGMTGGAGADILFYRGCAEYFAADYDQAYRTFLFCAENSASGKYHAPSLEYAAKSAVRLGNFRDAALLAEKLVNASNPGTERQNAVVFTAEILSDSGDFKAALDFLSPYAAGDSGFARRAVFMSAKICENSGDVHAAESFYQSLYAASPADAYSEEALFRSAGMFYSEGDYTEAQKRYNRYIYAFPEGGYSDAALYFCGDCAFRLGDYSRSAMVNGLLVSDYPESVYRYGALRNLAVSCYRSKSYADALDAAEILVREYADQAADDGTASLVIELRQLVSGADAETAAKSAEYIGKGGISTAAGRMAGTELAEIYGRSSATFEKAFELASELLAVQEKNLPAEANSAARTAAVVAEYYRRKGENRRAAGIFLDAAKYYRESGSDDGAAASLYGAAESFSAAGMKADSEKTSGLLRELYPDSRYAASEAVGR